MNFKHWIEQADDADRRAMALALWRLNYANTPVFWAKMSRDPKPFLERTSSEPKEGPARGPFAYRLAAQAFGCRVQISIDEIVLLMPDEPADGFMVAIVPLTAEEMEKQDV